VFVITGLWGVCLSFSTVCISWDNGTLHLDCSNVYSDIRSSVVFVASWYTALFIFGMISLLSQQMLLISFNLTGDEWRRSSRNKPFWEILWKNRYNKGFIRNWIEFLFMQDVASVTEEVV